MEQGIYNILTYLIIAGAMFVAGKKLYEKAFPKKQSTGCGDGCGGCASKCDLKEFASKLDK